MAKAELDETHQQKKLKRGLNLKVIRNLIASLRPELKNQEAFAIACGVGVSTLRQWEAGLLYGLSEVGADIVINFARTQNVICTKSWLLEGIGDSPRIDNYKQTINKIIAPFDNNASHTHNIKVIEKATCTLEKEMEIFKQMNDEAITLQIEDDSMLPLYLQGDYLGGQFLSKTHIVSALDKDCIIKLESGQIIVRHLTKGDREGLYKAYCINIQAIAKHDPLFNISIKTAAPITRVWRKQIK